jgi:hypothetical protein
VGGREGGREGSAPVGSYGRGDATRRDACAMGEDGMGGPAEDSGTFENDRLKAEGRQKGSGPF